MGSEISTTYGTKCISCTCVKNARRKSLREINKMIRENFCLAGHFLEYAFAALKLYRQLKLRFAHVRQMLSFSAFHNGCMPGVCQENYWWHWWPHKLKAEILFARASRRYYYPNRKSWQRIPITKGQETKCGKVGSFKCVFGGVCDVRQTVCRKDQGLLLKREDSEALWNVRNPTCSHFFKLVM
jgi:hypothetical protein